MRYLNERRKIQNQDSKPRVGRLDVFLNILKLIKASNIISIIKKTGIVKIVAKSRRQEVTRGIVNYHWETTRELA